MKETLMSMKLKWSADRSGTYYLTAFLNGKSIVIDSWEYPALFKELLRIYSAPEKVWNSRSKSIQS
jgi:hypothetical protein